MKNNITVALPFEGEEDGIDAIIIDRKVDVIIQPEISLAEKTEQREKRAHREEIILAIIIICITLAVVFLCLISFRKNNVGLH